MHKSLLLRQKNETITQTQDSKGRAGFQPKILAELFGASTFHLS